MLRQDLKSDEEGFWRAVQADTPDEYATSDPYGVESNINGPFQQMRRNGTLEALKATGAVSGPVLDIGCGEGHITRNVADHYPTAELWGIDLSISASARHQNVSPRGV